MAGPWPPGVPGAVPGPMAPPEPEADTMSNAQRSTLKWEKEETLGEMATVAPVLYTNMNFPNLREEFPGKSFPLVSPVFNHEGRSVNLMADFSLSPRLGNASQTDCKALEEGEFSGEAALCGKVAFQSAAR